MSRIHIVMENRVIREAIADALNAVPGFRVVGLSPDSPAVLAKIADTHPDVILLGVTYQTPTAAIVGRCGQAAPDAKVVVLFLSGRPTADDPPQPAPGAHAALDPGDGMAELAAAIRSVTN